MSDDEVIHNARTFFDEEDEEIARLEAQLEPEVRLETGYDSIIVVDELPPVGRDKLDTLLRVLAKVCSTCGKVGPENIIMPLNKDGVTERFAIVEFETAEEASTALTKLQNFKFGKGSVLHVASYADFAHYLEVPDTLEEKVYPPYEPKFNPFWWLLDRRAMDQYLINYGDDTEIYWNDALRKPEPLYARQFWTETHELVWSPHGTYLATYHAKGVILWAGESWGKVHQFMHPGVRLLEFSPCEGYMVTYSQENAGKQDIFIWNTRTGERLRGFNTPGIRIKWAFDDKYFAILGKGTISVYDSASMSLLDKKSIKVAECQEFQWSPKDHFIAAWIPEVDDHPARVLLLEIPSRREIASKTWFNATNCEMFWQGQGNFLCVHVKRFVKTKKSTVSNFEIFRIREKNVPVSVLELKDTVHEFAWEPVGSRFAIIHSEGTVTRYSVTFYEAGKKINELKTLENRAANRLFWSPKGGALVLAGLKSFNGALEFYNVDLMETMSEETHFMATDVAWDPAGRFVCSQVSARLHMYETGYSIWSFQGQLVHKVIKDRFYHFQWRPRPPTLLSAEKIKSIKSSLNKYAKEFKRDEDDVINIHIREDREKKAQQVKEFAARVALWRKVFDEQREKRLELRGGVVERDDEWEETTELVEEVIEESEESI